MHGFMEEFFSSSAGDTIGRLMTTTMRIELSPLESVSREREIRTQIAVDKLMPRQRRTKSSPRDKWGRIGYAELNTKWSGLDMSGLV